MLEALFSTPQFAVEYARGGPFFGFLRERSLGEKWEELQGDFRSKRRRLEGVLEQLRFIEVDAHEPSDTGPEPLERLERLLGQFHRVARRLTHRHAGRPTVEITDEYDVQDLLGGLLLIDFDDVRPEEYSPSYAGAATRIDYLLKDHAIVCETKMTRADHRDSAIGDELIIDAARYRGHPDAQVLVCFVYDPGGHLRNPAGLKRDLEGIGGERLRILVIATPTD